MKALFAIALFVILFTILRPIVAELLRRFLED